MFWEFVEEVPYSFVALNENFKAVLLTATFWILGLRSFKERPHPRRLFPDGAYIHLPGKI